MYYEPEKIRAYMGTAPTARDMLEIVDRLEDHRPKSIANFPSAPSTQDSLTGQGAEHSASQLQYWGLSYGSFLGNTFASLYPDRVKRMVLDGVIDAPDYVATGWSTNLQDTEKVLRIFYQSCYDAGPSRCPIYHETGPEGMETGIRNLLDHLRDHPIAAIVQPDDTTEVYPGLITYSDVKKLIFSALSNPITTFPTLATILSGLQRENYQEILGLLAIQTRDQCGHHDPNDLTFSFLNLKAPRPGPFGL